MRHLSELPLGGKCLLIREDFNVPMDSGGAIRSEARLEAALPTVRAALAGGAGALLLSHLGRPRSGAPAVDNAAFSLAPVARRLGQMLGLDVPLVPHAEMGARRCAPGEVALLENVRFLRGETDNDPVLARRLAALGDIFVMDAFATAHRAHASTCGIAAHAQSACAGPLLVAELAALKRAFSAPAKPVVAVVGGAKISTKLGVLRRLATKVDRLIVGGGLANTFLAAAGHRVAHSLFEAECVAEARALAAALGDKLLLPEDVVVAVPGAAPGTARSCLVSEVGPQEAIYDFGADSAARVAALAAAAGTLIWNGPLGRFEEPAFCGGTRALARAAAACRGYTLAGGGDTLAAIDLCGIAGRLSYVSTGGGAFLRFAEGRELPGVAALEALGEDPSGGHA